MVKAISPGLSEATPGVFIGPRHLDPERVEAGRVAVDYMNVPFTVGVASLDLRLPAMIIAVDEKLRNLNPPQPQIFDSPG